MYNANQKMKFIELYPAKNSRVKLVSIFNNTEKFEEEAGYDICNFPTSKYAEIVLTAFNVNSFLYLESLVGALMNYRNFCVKSNLIEDQFFYTNIETTTLFGVTKNDLYETYKVYLSENKAESIYTPESFFRCLDNEILEPSKGVEDKISEIYGDKKEVMIRKTELIVALLLFIYFGITEDEDLADIRLDGIDGDMHEELFNLVKKRFLAEYAIFESHGIHYDELGKEYFFEFEIDKSKEDRIKRVKLFKISYQKMTRKSNGKLPSVRKIENAGRIYRLYRSLSDSNVDINDKKGVQRHCKTIPEFNSLNKSQFEDIYLKLIENFN